MHFTIFTQNLEIKTGQGTIYTRGLLDPRPLTTGPMATLESQAGLVGWGNGPARPAPRCRQRPAMAAATAWKKVGERGRPDHRLTGEMPMGSAWPKDGRRRRISAAEELISSEVSMMVVATPATSSQFLWRGRRGGRYGASQHVSGAGEGTGRRC
jgi:hypothetical protein